LGITLGACSTLPCTRSWERSKLGFHKISLARIFHVSRPFLADTISPMSRLQIMQIWCLNCVEQNYIQLWYSMISLEMKIIPKMTSSDNLISNFSMQQVFWGPYLLAPWSELGFPYVQIEALNKAHNFGI
jgi:hypothetical protein